MTPGINELENVGVYISDLNPFVFQQLKKDCLDGLEHIEKTKSTRSGDLLEMFHQDLPKEVYFRQPTKSKEGLTRELLNACRALLKQYPLYESKLGLYGTEYNTEDKSVELFVERYWINYQLPGEFVPLHRHSGIFSFVVWVNIPENTIKQVGYNLMKGYQGHFEFTYPSIIGDLSSTRLATDKSWEGKMCVFPAELHHQVYPHFENETRISVSGNVRAKIL